MIPTYMDVREWWYIATHTRKGTSKLYQEKITNNMRKWENKIEDRDRDGDDDLIDYIDPHITDVMFTISK